MITVKLGARNLGQVEESFLKGLRPGDTFVLNARCVRLVSTTLLTAKVKPAAPRELPTIPRWNANKMPLASGLAAEVVRLRTVLAALLGADDPAGALDAETYLVDHYNLSPVNAAALARHFRLQARVSRIPTAAALLVEEVPEPANGLLHYFFHTLVGRSANDALSRIVAQRLQRRLGGNALVTLDDYGFLLTVRPFQKLADADAIRALLTRGEAENDLRAALAESELVKWQFRGVAQTGLLVPRRVRGAERGAKSLQWSAEILFDVLRRHEPDHPLLVEAYAEATTRFLDLPAALGFLGAAAELPVELVRPARVSPFAFGMFVSRIKETMMLEDPETTIERLYHEMYAGLADASDL
jgi:ATP-dependent Lhr-like helicase